MGDYKLVILGCGVMGQALLSAIYHAPAVKDSAKLAFYPSKIITCNHDEESTQQVVDLVKTWDKSPNGVQVECTYNKNREVCKDAKVVIIAAKPYLAASVLDSAALNSDQLLLSIVAGWDIKQLETYCNRVSRIMTNTPARYAQGCAVVSHSSRVTEQDKQLVKELIGQVGMYVELPEKNMNAATALVGSGPAFVLLMLESLMESGIKLGIPLKESKECALKVLEGTAKMVQLTGQHPSVLKHQVCTPGGTTIAGLCTMEENGVKSGIIKGVEEAANVAARMKENKS